MQHSTWGCTTAIVHAPSSSSLVSPWVLTLDGGINPSLWCTDLADLGKRVPPFNKGHDERDGDGPAVVSCIHHPSRERRLSAHVVKVFPR
ncbi:uncharacterized protein ARMOST_07675 [Armillaria ostoyae]|uniref:Uncharacterized protein n=1 Tax=Armillaria ostoyae TaxID=47428 RepID=A0A284R6J7_ARMOS|nr:uncharacterized protein ARMOST_07675 [Armillaria ostoyae]